MGYPLVRAAAVPCAFL